MSRVKVVVWSYVCDVFLCESADDVAVGDQIHPAGEDVVRGARDADAAMRARGWKIGGGSDRCPLHRATPRSRRTRSAS